MSLIPVKIPLSPTWGELNTDIATCFKDGDNIEFYFRLYDSKPFEILVDTSGALIIDATYNGKGIRIDQNYNNIPFVFYSDYKYYARTIDGENSTINVHPGFKVDKQTTVNTDFAGNTSLNTLIGEGIVGELTDAFNVMFEYNVGTYDTTRLITGTGSITHADAKAQLRTGLGIGSTKLQSKDPINYRTGHQVNAEGTAVFAIPEVGVTQKIGLGDDVETLAAFGYDTNLNWGIWLQTIEDGKIHIPQSQFNGDKVDGLGDSGFTINPQGENLYKLFYGWYGVLPIVWGVHVAGLGYIVLHTYDRSNEANTPHLANPSIPFITKIERLSGSGVDMALETSSWRGAIVGKRSESSLSNRKFLIKTVKTINGADVPIYSIRNNTTFQSKTNHVVVALSTFTASSEGTKQVEIDLYIGGALTGGIWNAIDVENSVVDYNNTAISYIPPAQQIGATVLGKVDRVRINLSSGDVRIPVYPGQELHIIGTTSNSSDLILDVRHSEGF